MIGAVGPALHRALHRPGWLLALAALAIHLAVGRGYGYFRDELYFIVCAGILIGVMSTSRRWSR